MGYNLPGIIILGKRGFLQYQPRFDCQRPAWPGRAKSTLHIGYRYPTGSAGDNLFRRLRFGFGRAVSKFSSRLVLLEGRICLRGRKDKRTFRNDHKTPSHTNVLFVTVFNIEEKLLGDFKLF